MPKLKDVTRYVRSKVAGPFWITLDVFFPDAESYRLWHQNPTLQPDAVARLYGISPTDVAVYPVESLNMVKISFPRERAQGGEHERDLHSGQQFVYLSESEMA